MPGWRRHSRPPGLAAGQRPARGPVECPRALRPSGRSAGAQSLAGKRRAPGAMSGRPQRRHAAAVWRYCMCQRMRQPWRTDMRSILLQTFLMVVMGSTSFRRPASVSGRGRWGFIRVTAARGPGGACGSAVSLSVVARPVNRPGSRTGFARRTAGPEPRTTSTIMVSPGSRTASVTVVTHRLSDRPPPPRPPPRMPDEPDHLLLRRYHAARQEGRDDEAARVWERLAENNFDRIKQICSAFRYTGGTGLPATETGSAATE